MPATHLSPDAERATVIPGSRRAAALWAAALGVVIIAARAVLLSRYGSAMPFWDQWDGEWANFLLPLLEQRLTWTDLFAAHNEHRIVLTRLWLLTLFRLNANQWDPLLEALASNALFAIIVGWIAYRSVRWWAHRAWPLLIVLLCVGVTPFSWGNSLSGFQSAIYFVLLCSLAAGALLSTSHRGAHGLLILAGCGLAFLGAAGGLFASLAVALTLVARRFLFAGDLKRRPMLLATSLLLTVILYQYVPSIPGHDFLRAHSAKEFLPYLILFVAWPVVDSLYAVLAGNGLALFSLAALAALAINTPALVWVARRLRHPGAPTPACLFAVYCLLFYGLQVCALAFARGGPGLHPPASRHTDLLWIGLLGNAALLLDLGAMRAYRWPAAITAPIWIGFVTAGMLTSGYLARPHFEERAHLARQQEQNVGMFLATGDPQFLRDKPAGYIPYPDPGRLQSLLSSPILRGALPPEWNTLPMLPVSGYGFVAGGTAPSTHPLSTGAVVGSYADRGGRSTGGTLTAPMTTEATWLQVPVAGYLGVRETLSLTLIPEDEAPIPVSPRESPGEAWRYVLVRAPYGPFRMEARDNDSGPQGWFAFGEPRQLGPLSYWVRRWLGWAPARSYEFDPWSLEEDEPSAA